MFAASQGWLVENGRFDEVGFSGATLDRPSLQRLLAFLREDGADRRSARRFEDTGEAHRRRCSTFGYDADPRAKQLVPNAAEAEIIQWMFEQATAGRRPAEIAETANKLSIRTKANGRWSARQVVATLRNPVYIGKFKDGKGERRGCHQPIVDMAVFEAAGRAIDSHRTGQAGTHAIRSRLAIEGKVYCCRCGRILTPHSCRHGMKVYRYYRCRAISGDRDFW